jgi:tetratricopeptide (TPR) repeat protein
MKVYQVLTLTVSCTVVWMAAAAPDSTAESSLKRPEKSLTAHIQDLADHKFQVREIASQEIWKVGEPALEALQAAAAGDDPEQAYRANELIRKIQLHITPETDPAVIALVERYAKATASEKPGLFDQMHKRRAWRQMLKLYASETNPDLRSRLGRLIEGVAVVAARERIVAGDPAGAREFLEMAPADAAGLLALADFHRSQGSLDAEFERAKNLNGIKADAWRLALHRATGNLEAARDSARKAGEPMIAAAMAALLGDPLPWLRLDESDGRGGGIHRPYTEAAIKRWQGKELRAADLEPLVRSANSKNQEERQRGVNSLFLLGETALAENGYAALSRPSAFTYYESLERIPDALKMLGLDPRNPDYTQWVADYFERMSVKGVGDDEDLAPDTRELILLGNFLERRGLHDQCAEAFLSPLAALAEKDRDSFMDLLGQWFGGEPGMNGEIMGVQEVAKQAAIAWAGDSAERWEEVINTAFGGQEEFTLVLDWLSDLEPGSGRVERFEAMLALIGFGRDPELLRKKWLKLAWKAVEQAPEQQRDGLLEKVGTILYQNPDVINNLKLWDQMPEHRRMEGDWRTHILDLSAAGRWADAASFFQQQIDKISTSRLDPQPSLHACLAACLRNAGRMVEADAQDKIVETLALGHDAIEIANGYAYGSDYRRAADWWARATRQNAPESNHFSISLQLHGATLLEQGKWKEAASLSELTAQAAATIDPSDTYPIVGLRLRLQSDLGRALALLPKDRTKAVAILAKSHASLPSDGSLADDFFPAVRKSGLIKEHDEWFKTTWDFMSAVIQEFPNSDNTCNTAAWLASRACRNLDPAEKLLQHALALNPEQPPYLDTMAEIHFAKGNRAKAVEWSSEAINFMPLDIMLRRQHERFQSAPLPR